MTSYNAKSEHKSDNAEWSNYSIVSFYLNFKELWLPYDIKRNHAILVIPHLFKLVNLLMLKGATSGNTYIESGEYKHLFDVLHQHILQDVGSCKNVLPAVGLKKKERNKKLWQTKVKFSYKNRLQFTSSMNKHLIVNIFGRKTCNVN